MSFIFECEKNFFVSLKKTHYYQNGAFFFVRFNNTYVEISPYVCLFRKKFVRNTTLTALNITGVTSKLYK